jgi:hypothetical protein
LMCRCIEDFVNLDFFPSVFLYKLNNLYCLNREFTSENIKIIVLL